MSERLTFVRLAEQDDANISELCRQFQISRKTGYKLLARYRQAGEAGLIDRSRRPHHSPHQTPPAVVAAVLAVRAVHPAWGGRKIQRWLTRQGLAAPSPSTITHILHQHGQLETTPFPAPVTWQRFVAERPNDLWQIDFKGGIQLIQEAVFPLSVLDDHSRYALGLFACRGALWAQQLTTVRAHLTALFIHYGLPRRILTDNGPPWGSSGQDGITALEAWWIQLGILVSHGRFYHPQTQGKVERFHGTLARELLQQPLAVDRPTCQVIFDHWRDSYNQERPHEALDLAVPIERYVPSPRPLPAVLTPLVYPPGDAVRRVNAHGVISFQHRRYFVGRGVAGQPVAVRPDPDGQRPTVYFCDQLIKVLDRKQPVGVSSP